VESLDLRASELAERVRTEQAAGRFLGDTEIITTTMIEEQRKNGDYIQAIGAIPNAKNLRAPFKATEISVPAYVQPMGILVNTRLVKPEDEPKSWDDLNDPKWKGKILADDMRPLGSGNTMFAILQKKLGAAFNENWRNRNRFQPRPAPTMRGGWRAANTRSTSRRSSPLPPT